MNRRNRDTRTRTIGKLLCVETFPYSTPNEIVDGVCLFEVVLLKDGVPSSADVLISYVKDVCGESIYRLSILHNGDTIFERELIDGDSLTRLSNVVTGVLSDKGFPILRPN